MKPTKMVTANSAHLKDSLQRGLRKGYDGFIWVFKIILPVSLATTLLLESGVLRYFEPILSPFLASLGLPACAFLPMLVGMVGTLYAGIAAMVALPLGSDEMTIIAVYLLIAHNLIQEGLVQSRSGLPFWRATLIRLLVAFICALFVSWLLAISPTTGANTIAVAATSKSAAFSEILMAWFASTAWLALKAFAIILTIFVGLEILRDFGGMEALIRYSQPLLRPMGLAPKTGFIWCTAALFGLAYTGALIEERAKEAGFTPQEKEALQVSIGINHALLEDPLLFIALGISPVLLYLPRFVAAAAFAQLTNLFYRLRRS